jgi:hypothetical protein
MSDRSEQQPLDLDQFTLWKATFEARTALNFLQWDRSGLIASELYRKRPTFEVSSAAPDKIVFKDGKLTFAVAFKPPEEHTSIAVTEESPHQSLNGLIEAVEQIINVTSSCLEFDEFNRIGLRLMFVKEYKSLSDATEALLKTNLLQYPPGPHFGVDGTPAHPSYILKWEDGKKGAMVHLTVEKRKVEFNPPADWDGISGFKKEINRILFDFDSYTIAKVNLSQLTIADWITNAVRLNRRDSGKFLRGL